MQLTVMTINVRTGSADDGDHAWPNRRPIMVEMLNEYRPDIFGVQEGERYQLDDIVEALPGYACFGEGRQGLDGSEHNAIFYNLHRLHCLEGQTFWLSKTPEIPASKSWESSLPRIVTWGRFQVKATQVPIHFYNTHFDHRSEAARQGAAQLLWARSRDRKDITFLVGDFNCTRQSFAWQYLTGEASDANGVTGDFEDAWYVAEEQINRVSTFHGFRGAQEGDRRIDWILMRPELRVLRAETVIYRRNGLHASDHFAVYAELEIPDRV